MKQSMLPMLVGIAHDAAAGDKLVMQCLHTSLRRGVDRRRRTLKALNHAGLKEVAHVLGTAVDLVEGEPELDLVLIAVEDGLMSSRLAQPLYFSTRG